MRRPILTLFSYVIAAAAVMAQDAGEEKAKPEEPDPDHPEEKGRGPNTEGWEPYVEILESSHTPPAKAGDKPAVQVKFNLSPDVPKGSRVNFEFEFNGLEFENVDYVLKDENRRGLTLVWRPAKRLGVGEYFIRTRLHPDQQTPAIQKVLAQNEKRFPSKNAPWMWYYFEKPIMIGSPADEAAEKEALCQAYTDMVDKLVANMVEFVDKMEEVKAGKALVNGKTLDVAKLKEYVAEWRKKQGGVQQEIVEFPEKEQALFQQSITTYQNLRELGRMVSKRSRDLLKEVTEQYKVQETINPPGHQHFDLSYRFKVNLDEMNRRMDIIAQQVCPKEKEEEPEGGEAAAGDDPDAKKEKDAEKAAEEKPAESEEPKEDEKPKAKDKKKPASKKKPAK
jgi:hypothetical protein